MKILLATSYDYPHLGGLSTHLATLKTGLENRGHTVDIVSFSDVPAWKRNLIARGPAFILNKIKKGSGYVWTLQRRKEFIEKLVKERIGQDYDLVNAQDVFANGCPGFRHSNCQYGPWLFNIRKYFERLCG